ncbi:MAG: UDP-N-acetylmuramoyl-tripeptide--D-alanyl-D-alanine ligase [Actinobacteria bacterium]|nr:UDP-N-acetylmuramoyl-tripeptide--D-alanyl-D-alanine ligase [Actinomycetota bacterium]
MGRSDPFSGYTVLLWIIIYGLVPAFGAWQYFRLRRALHVFQLEGYKRQRFLRWCRDNAKRALFLAPSTDKKPLVMTGRAWRILVTALALSVLAILVPAGLAHVWLDGFPADVVTWGLATVLVFLGTPVVLVGADIVMAPVQAMVNARFKTRARRRLAGLAPVVIGVTGSFGKTSTKFAIATLLGGPEVALATPGSFNTPLGLTRAINEHLTPQHRYFVAEMGAYKEGEIADLMELVRPRIGVLTAIGPAHLDRFGSMDAIRRGKYEIVRDLPPDGIAVMNVDDPEVRALADQTEHVQVVRYGIDPAGAPDITAGDITTSASGTSFTIFDSRWGGASIQVTTRLLGKHAVGHVLAAVAVAVSAGEARDDLPARIERLQPVEHRLQLIQGTGGITVIDDAFNSNPAGAAAALDVLGAMPGGKKVVVTPGIIELGPLQREANEDFGEHAVRVADAVVFVAKLNRDALVAGARRVDGGGDVITVDTLAEATAKLPGLIGPGDVVLFENDLPDQYEG